MKTRGCLTTVLTIFLTFFGLLVGCFFLSMETMLLLPKGEHVGTYSSPSGEHCIDVYTVSGNATVDVATRCEVAGKGMLRHNLYWAYHVQNATVEWRNDRTAAINGVPLDIYRDRYDYRKETPQP